MDRVKIAANLDKHREALDAQQTTRAGHPALLRTALNNV